MRFFVALAVFAFVACSSGSSTGGMGGGSAYGGGSGGGVAGGNGGSGSGGGGGGGMHEIEDAGVTCDGSETFQAATAAMMSNCGGAGPHNCHSISPFDGNMDLRAPHAYANLYRVPAIVSDKLRVAPGDPLGSFLTQKLTSKMDVTEGGPMPQQDGMLWHAPDPEKLRVLECWILSGAPNN